MPTGKLYLVDVVEKPLKHAQQRILEYTEKAIGKKRCSRRRRRPF
jgi:hypothetical protein